MVMNMNVEMNRKKVKIGAYNHRRLYYIFLYLSSSMNKGPEIPVPKVVVQKPQWREMIDYVTQTGTLSLITQLFGCTC